MARYELRRHDQARTVGIYRTTNGMPVVVKRYGWMENEATVARELKQLMEILELEVDYVLSTNSTH